MPTISQLAPATAASDSDEMVVSQAGVTRKVTRAQVLAGLQPQLSAASGSLLGRSSKGVGAPEVIAIGDNLILASGTLSASASPFVLSEQEDGVVPASGDLVGVGQGGHSKVVTYRQFLSGLPSVPNIDASQTVVTPTGQTTPTRLADLAGRLVLRDGATMTGKLALAGDPVDSAHAVNKGYIDTRISDVLPKSGGLLSGPLTLSGDPALGPHAANKNYVDAQVSAALLRSGGTLVGPLVLGSDPSAAMQSVTKQYADKRLLRSGDTMAGYLLLSADPTVDVHAATKRYVDQEVAGVLSLGGGTIEGPLTLSGAPTSALHSATKAYVDGRVARAGDTLIGTLVLSGDPVATLDAATKQYVDTRVLRAGDTLSGPLALAADPVGTTHAARKGYVDSKVSATLAKAGGTLSGMLTVVYPDVWKFSLRPGWVRRPTC